MSEFSVKSWSGILDHTFLSLCWSIFNILNNALKNFVFTYFKRLFAVFSLSKLPIHINVWVYPVFGGTTIGVLNVSPNSPFPLALGTITFHFDKLS